MHGIATLLVLLAALACFPAAAAGLDYRVEVDAPAALAAPLRQGLMQEVAKVSRAAAYDATDPSSVDKVFNSVLSNF